MIICVVVGDEGSEVVVIVYVEDSDRIEEKVW